MSCLCLEKRVFTNRGADLWDHAPGSLAADAAKFQTELETLRYQTDALIAVAQRNIGFLKETSGTINLHQIHTLIRFSEELSTEVGSHLESLKTLNAKVTRCATLSDILKDRTLLPLKEIENTLSNTLKSSRFVKKHFQLIAANDLPEDKALTCTDRFFSTDLPLVAERIMQGDLLFFRKAIQSGSFGKVSIFKIGHLNFAGKRAGRNPSAPLTLQREVQLLSTIPPHRAVIPPPIWYQEEKRDGTLTTLLSPLYETDLFNEMFTLSIAQKKTCLREIARGLAHINQSGVVHRDLKPANILLTKTNRPLICDFGISQREGFLKGARGDWSFASPEIVTEKYPLMPTMDSWGLANLVTCIFFGITVNELLVIKRNGCDYTEIDCYQLSKQMKSRFPSLLEIGDKELQELAAKVINDIGTKKLPLLTASPESASMDEKLIAECKEYLELAVVFDPAKRISCQETTKLPFFKDKTSEAGESKGEE